MENPLDVELTDRSLDDEIRLVTELMVVATMAPGELEQDGHRRDARRAAGPHATAARRGLGPLSGVRAPRLDRCPDPRTEEDLPWECWTGSPARETSAT